MREGVRAEAEDVRAEAPTEPRDEEQVLDAMTHRVSQRQVDKGFDVEMIHQG